MLAIVIPYFKFKYFEETLKSISQQTDKKFKVFIGDDASPESPKALLDKFNGKFNYKYHRFQYNLGSKSLVHQWERCLKMVDNEKWIMMLGDDDILGSTVVETLNSFVGDNYDFKTNVIRFSTCKIDSAGNQVSKIYNFKAYEDSKNIIFNNIRSSLSEYVFKAETIQKIKFKNFPLAWFSDVLAVLEFSGFDKVYTINTAIVKVRVSLLSISGKSDNNRFKEVAKFRFYHYLLSKKSVFFSAEEKGILFNRLENSFFNNKKNILFLFLINKECIKMGSLMRLIIFYYRLMNTFLKKVKLV